MPFWRTYRGCCNLIIAAHEYPGAARSGAAAGYDGFILLIRVTAGYCENTEWLHVQLGPIVRIGGAAVFNGARAVMIFRE